MSLADIAKVPGLASLNEALRQGAIGKAFRYPSASLTIGLVLKTLIDNGLLELRDTGYLCTTSLCDQLHKTGTKLKIEFPSEE